MQHRTGKTVCHTFCVWMSAQYTAEAHEDTHANLPCIYACNTNVLAWIWTRTNMQGAVLAAVEIISIRRASMALMYDWVCTCATVPTLGDNTVPTPKQALRVAATAVTTEYVLGWQQLHADAHRGHSSLVETQPQHLGLPSGQHFPSVPSLTAERCGTDGKCACCRQQVAVNASGNSEK